MHNVRARHVGIGQAFLSAFVEERQFGVVDTELMENCGVQIEGGIQSVDSTSGRDVVAPSDEHRGTQALFSGRVLCRLS